MQKLSERGKKPIWLWISWTKRLMEWCVLVWVQVQGCMLSWAILNTFLKASSSWSWTRIAICTGEKKPFPVFLRQSMMFGYQKFGGEVGGQEMIFSHFKRLLSFELIW